MGCCEKGRGMPVTWLQLTVDIMRASEWGAMDLLGPCTPKEDLASRSCRKVTSECTGVEVIDSRGLLDLVPNAQCFEGNQMTE